MHWTRQAYLTFIPVYPMGYLLIHGYRGEEPWTKLYVNRSQFEASPHLKDLVENELDNMNISSKAKTLVTITDNLEPKVYGGFFLNPGAELQFPLRASFEDVEEARRLSANLEIDLGLQKNRRKIEIGSAIGDELVSRMMLSDVAKKFLVQRQLQIANSGQFFCVPLLTWVGISTGVYAVMAGLSAFTGPIVGLAAGIGISIGTYYQFLKGYSSYKTKRADEMTAELGDDYERGAKEYFLATMKFNRLTRHILGEEGEINITKSGDIKLDSPTYSERLKNVEQYLRKKRQNTE